MKAWGILNTGAFLIILGIALMLAFVSPPLLPQGLFVPFMLTAFGVWLLVLAGLKRMGRPNLYEFSPMEVAVWGVLLGGVGSLWIISAQASTFSLLAVGVLIIAVGVGLVVYAAMRK